MITSKLKRYLSGLLAALMLVTLLPSAAWADTVASGTCGDNLTWAVDDEGTLTISGTGEMEDYWEDAPWYAYRGDIKKVVIQQGVTSIGNDAFYGCTSLSSITIPNSVTSIGGGAFEGCKSLTSITIPDSVTSIGYGAFYYCTSLTGITIPNSVTIIGSSAFSGCTSLTGITIPNSVTIIGSSAFSGCTSLTAIQVASGNPNYSSSSGVLCNKAKTELILCPEGFTGSYTIPNSVTSIYSAAFSGCTSLTSISIPDSVTSIGRDAFDDCTSLTSVNIGSGVTYISPGMFSSCSGLTTIQVASENPNYSSSSGVLFNKEKTELILCPEGFTGSYTIPNSVTSIYSAAFSGCTSLTSVSIPNSVTSIDNFTFGTCTSLTSISIPDSVTSIGRDAFGGCTSLSSIRIGSGVTHIEERAFSDTAYYNDEDNWTNGILYVDACLLEAKSDITTASIRSGTKLIATEAFANCKSLTSVTIPNGVTAINDLAFYGCSGLTQVKLPKGIDKVSHGVFLNCSSLESVTVPEGVKTIEYDAFGIYESGKGCESLKEVTLPKSLTTIENYAFCGSKNLEDVYYTGSETQWNEISIGEWGNSYLTGATIHYNYSPEPVTPSAPKISSSIVSSTGRIKLTWSAVDNAAKYYIYRSTDGGSTYKYYDSTTKTTYTNTSVTPGKTYYYKLKAVGEDGTTSKYSNVVYRTADCARPVVKISNVASSGALKLTWDSVTGASKYYIYRSTDMGETYTYYTSTTSTSWTNKSVTPGKTYYYKVKAICGKSSYGDSAYSTAVSRTADCARPVVKVSNVASSGAIKLTWDKVTGASKYYVYRSTDGGKTYSYYTSTTSTSWTNKSVTPGKTYYYKVIAVCGKSSYGNSAYSTAVSRSADCARPDVTITRSSSGKPLLKWKAITGAEEYVIYRATSKTGTYTKMFTTTKLSYTNTGAKAGTTYYYKVMAICAKSSYGNSAYSNIVSIKSK